MKKIKLFLCALMAAMCLGSTASADEVTALGLRFARSGTNAASVAVSVVDQNGAAIPGATASVTTSHDFKATNSNITESILCPNVNGSSGPTIVLTFSIAGLPAGISFNNVGLDIHALNGSSAYQQNNDSKERRWNVVVKSGASADALADFASLDNIDIAAGVGESGAVHKVWDAAAATAVTVGENLTVELTITKGTANVGCFFGLSELTLSTGEAPEIPEPVEPTPEINPEAYYFIKWSQNTTLYMTESSTGGVIVAGEDVSQKQFWQFVPTENAGCYYVKNAASGKYIQSCNMANSNQSLITVGDTPVEYYVPLCTSTASVKGCYRLTSTDCENYANSASQPHGLNKDGASTNVIVWMAGEGNVGSWWKLVETEYLYDLRPFNFSENLSTAKYIYSIASAATGNVLEMAEDGTLSWQIRNDGDAQTWYFVGEGNCVNGGFMIANLATGLTVNLEGEEQTKWTTHESTNGYVLRPYATMNDAASNLKVAEETEVLFKEMRSKYSRSVQIYALPCGELGAAYVAKASIDHAVKPMTYPLAEINGTSVSQPSASAPTYWYTIYSQDKATVAPGQTFNLNLTLSAAPAANLETWVYFDWNRDGVFEVAYLLASALDMSREVTVPEDAKMGESRMRVRLTTNGLEEGDDCVADGQIIDFLINVAAAPAEYTCVVDVNDEARGTAAAELDGTNVKATASPLGDALFLCWKEGKNVLSVDEEYIFTLNHDTRLTAFFTPITDFTEVGIDPAGLNEENLLLDVKADRGTIRVETSAEVRLVLVYTPDGALVGKSKSNEVAFAAPLSAGTYIVKVFTEDSDKVCKAYIK